jgi:hypothetical protein
MRLRVLRSFNPKYYLCLDKVKTVKTGITREEFDRDFHPYYDLANKRLVYFVNSCGDWGDAVTIMPPAIWTMELA